MYYHSLLSFFRFSPKASVRSSVDSAAGTISVAVTDSLSIRPPPKKKTKDKSRSGEESSSSFDSLTTSAADAQDTVSSGSVDTVSSGSSVPTPTLTETTKPDVQTNPEPNQCNKVGFMLVIGVNSPYQGINLPVWYVFHMLNIHT